MRMLALLHAAILVVFVLLGNGLRSVAAMTVSVSQAEFASFLNISVEKTDLLVEIMLGGALMALAVAPFLLSPATARRVALPAAVAAAVAYAAIGLTMRISPALAVREVVVIACFTLGGFAVAFFAPLAQLAISAEADPKRRIRLTTIWTAASPIAFLIAPQLVKYVAFDIGTDNYFLLLAAVPLVFLALIPAVLPRAAAPLVPSTPVPWAAVGGFLLAVLLFEAWTASNSFAGIASPTSLVLLGLFAGYAVYLVRSMQPRLARAAMPAGTVSLLALLFVLEIPTTGLYDGAYLVRHLCSADLIADRATLGAAMQILAVFAGGAVLARQPRLEIPLLGAAVASLLVGSIMVMFYPLQGTESLIFYVSKGASSVGMGIASSVIVGRVVNVAHGNKLVELAPAFVVMFGTEVGIELLEIVFQAAKLLGADETYAYQAVFLAQVLAVLAALGLLAERMLSLVHPEARRAAAAV